MIVVQVKFESYWRGDVSTHLISSHLISSLLKALDYSDDEQEQQAKRKLKEQRRGEDSAGAGRTNSAKQNLHACCLQRAINVALWPFSNMPLT